MVFMIPVLIGILLITFFSLGILFQLGKIAAALVGMAGAIMDLVAGFIVDIWDAIEDCKAKKGRARPPE